MAVSTPFCGMATCLSAFLFALSVVNADSPDIKGPPVAQLKEIKKVVAVGQEVRVQCPISGNPPPIVEWRKGSEIIDYTWIRIRTAKKWIKIRKAQEEDTGEYICKGVNGFGSLEVKLDLIVFDPNKYPELKDGQVPDVTGPSFTPETTDYRLDYTRRLEGDSFKVSCEAEGTPMPEIFWFKDGLPFEADGIRYNSRSEPKPPSAQSTLRLRHLIPADSAVYTCLARNLIGAVTRNYTLAVESPSSTGGFMNGDDFHGAGGDHLLLLDQPTVVVGKNNGNATVMAGDTASLQCRVRSRAPPHIKWLKRQNPGAPDDPMFTIPVGEDRYRVIHTGEDIPVGGDEYLNKLVIVNAREDDSGLYICFVTNSAGSFTYRPSFLHVYPANGAGSVGGGLSGLGRDVVSVGGTDTAGGHNNIDHSPAVNGHQPAQESTHVLALVVCLGITVVLILIFIIVCVARKSSRAAAAKKAGGSGHSSSTSNGSLDSPDSPDVERSLMAGNNNNGGCTRSTQSSSTIATVASACKLMDQPLPPLPMMPPSTNAANNGSNNNAQLQQQQYYYHHYPSQPSPVHNGGLWSSMRQQHQPQLGSVKASSHGGSYNTVNYHHAGYQQQVPAPPPSSLMYKCASSGAGDKYTSKHNTSRSSEYLSAPVMVTRDAYSSSLLHENSSQNLLSPESSTNDSMDQQRVESPASINSVGMHHQYEVPYTVESGSAGGGVGPGFPTFHGGADNGAGYGVGGNSHNGFLSGRHVVGFPYPQYPYFQHLNNEYDIDDNGY